MAKAKFALIGNPLTHSFSHQIHSAFGYDYDLVTVLPEELESFVKSRAYEGFNVTIPHKQTIIPFLDDLDSTAKSTGSVNTVLLKNGKYVGYNTDFVGFIYLMKYANISFTDKKVVILGSGGTSKTVQTVAKHRRAKEVVVISRTGENNYYNTYLHEDAHIIVNTTPVGMYPNNGESPIDLEDFRNLEGVLDVIYNPHRTQLVLNARERGIKAMGGLMMLAAQAKYSRDLFLGDVGAESVITVASFTVRKLTTNIILIGMPGAGKTAIGRALAIKLNSMFADIDQVISKRESLNIPAIFEKYGEDFFRQAETQVCKECGKEYGQVIATGGGTPFTKENIDALRQNGVFIYIKRELDELASDGRPLSSSKKAIYDLAKTRLSQYESLATITIENNAGIQDAVNQILTELYAYFSH